MYKFLFIYLFITLLPPVQYSCFNTLDPINIDGKLEERSWKNAKKITLKDRSQRTKNSVIFKSVWDEKNLYLSFEVKDSNLYARQSVLDDPRLYLDDMVEFLIDPINEKDSCWGIRDIIYHINILGQKKDDRGSQPCVTNSRWNGIAKYGITIDGTLNKDDDIDCGYKVEVAIPWNEIGITPKSGVTIGFDFANGDNGKLYDWSGASPFRSPYAFGDLTLKKL
jgi:hypothetical protein